MTNLGLDFLFLAGLEVIIDTLKKMSVKSNFTDYVLFYKYKSRLQIHFKCSDLFTAFTLPYKQCILIKP